jgi:Chromate transporter
MEIPGHFSTEIDRLAFGGDHVAPPLLQAEVIARRWVTNETFLVGYGLTQAMPGPLFTFAAYLGAVKQTMPSCVLGSAIALIEVFLPGVLLSMECCPFGTNCETEKPCKPPCAAPTTPWLDFSGSLSTIRSPKARF